MIDRFVISSRCETFKSIEDCDPTLCQWSLETEACENMYNSKTDKCPTMPYEMCSNITGQANNCYWDPVRNVCIDWDTDVTNSINCQDFDPSECAEALTCYWREPCGCVDLIKGCNCAAFNSNKWTLCKDIPGCHWNDDVGLCQEDFFQVELSCSMYDDDPIYCDSKYLPACDYQECGICVRWNGIDNDCWCHWHNKYPETCENYSGCHYNFPDLLCVTIDTTIPLCEDYTNDGDCSATIGCEWNDQDELCLPKPSDPEIYDCSEFNSVYNCPTTACVWSECGVCSPKDEVCECGQYDEQEVCDDNDLPNCQFDPARQSCVSDKYAVLPCNELDITTCQSDEFPGCALDNDSDTCTESESKGGIINHELSGLSWFMIGGAVVCVLNLGILLILYYFSLRPKLRDRLKELDENDRLKNTFTPHLGPLPSEEALDNPYFDVEY